MTTELQRTKAQGRERQVMTFLREYMRDNGGRSPTLKELCRGTGISSTSVAAYWIDRLEAAGHLTRVAGQARSLRLVEPVPTRRRKHRQGALVVHGVASRALEAAAGEYRHRIRVEYVRAEHGGLNVRNFTGAGVTPAEALQRASAEMMKWLASEVGG